MCTDGILTVAQIGETIFYMKDLMDHSQRNELRPHDALKALVANYDEQAANQQANNAGGQAQQPMPPNAMPMNVPQRAVSGQFQIGPRTPMQGQMQLPPGQQANFSPSVAHMGMPMSHLNGPMPINGSPHIGNQQGLIQSGLAPNPGMSFGGIHTPSPHQTNMAAPPMIPQQSHQGTDGSAVSVNTSPNVNQKRRRSQVKMEGDDGGGGGNVDMNGVQGSRVKASPRVGGSNKKTKQ